MPDDRFPMHSADADRDLVAALRALPLASPKRSVYADLEHALVATRPSPLRAGRTRGAWIALAACLVAAIAGVRLFHPAADMATTDAVPSPDTLALIAQSQRLDDMLATLDARSVPIDAGTAMASAELEDLIGLTDLQLSVAERPEESLAPPPTSIAPEAAALRAAGTPTARRLGRLSARRLWSRVASRLSEEPRCASPPCPCCSPPC